MKLRVIKIIFLAAFTVFLVLGFLSLTHGHHNNTLDSLVLFLSALTYFLSYLALRSQSSGTMPGFLSDKVIRALYIATFILFIIIASLSFYHYRQMLAVSTLLLCAVTQILAYRTFVKQKK